LLPGADLRFLLFLPISFCGATTGVAVKRDVEGDLLCADIGQGLFFRPNSFDGAIRSVQGAGRGGRLQRLWSRACGGLRWLLLR